MQRGYAVALSIIGAIALTACTDYPTANKSEQPSAPVVNAAHPISSQLTPYVCAVSEKGVLGYRRGLIWIKFPTAFEAKDQATELYKMRIQSPSGETLAAADCRIPRTASARAAMDRRLSATLARAADGASSNASDQRPVDDKAPTRSPTNSPVYTALAMPEKKGPRYDLPTVIVTAIYSVWPGWGSYGSNCDWDCQEEMSNGGMQSNWGSQDPEPDLLPCPPSDATCLSTLSGADLQNIATSLNNLRKSDSDIPDATARAMCAKADSAFADLIANKKVYRGSWVSPDASHSDTLGGHWGAYSQTTGNMHFEPDLLDSVNVGSSKWQFILANVALHEGLHSTGLRHLSDSGTINSIYSESKDYSTFPFNYLNAGSANSCLKLTP